MTRLTAEENVMLASRRYDPNQPDVLLRRIRVNGKRMVYDVQKGIVNMYEPGTMMAEDYRKPARGEAAGRRTGNIDRPALTAFQWAEAMELHRSESERWVVLRGKVAMVHRSGRHVMPLVTNLKIPDWGPDVPAGRKTSLSCDRMLAKFGKPDDKKAAATKPATMPATRPATRPAADDVFDAGPKLGPLELFNATGNVNLTDGPRQVIGQRLIYDRKRDIVLIYGYRKGGRLANATLIEKDPVKMTERTVSSPKIIWHRETNRVEAGKISASGS